MKRLLVILALIGSSVFNSSFAADTRTSPVIVASFESAFTGAKEISWEQVGVFYKASFILNNQHAAAFYDAAGYLIAVTHNIATTQLPQALQTSLKKELAGSWISNAFVVNIEGANTYYVTIENAATTTTLKAIGAKKWSVYQKSGK